MCLYESLERSGNWLFRWRTYPPMLMVALYVLALCGDHVPFRSELQDHLWEAFCLLVSMIGLGIRVWTVAHVPPRTSGRNRKRQVAESLNTTGLYSVVRNPLYLGNFFLGLGPALFAHLWWLVVIYVLAFCLYYERIIAAEEAYLTRSFGETYLAWARKTPSFIPRLRAWRRPSRPFSLRTVLRRESDGLLACIISFFVLELTSDLVATHRLELDPPWAALLAFAILTWLTLRTLKKHTRLLSLEGN